MPSVEGRPKVTPKDIENMVVRAAELRARPATTRPTSSTTRTSFPTTATGSGARSGSRARDVSPRSARGSARRARCSASRRRCGRTACSSRRTSRPVRRDQRRRAGGVRDAGLDGVRDAALGSRGSRPRRDDRGRGGDRDDAPARSRGRRLRGHLDGANVVGAHRLAERLGPDAVIVTLAVDTAFKYMSVAPFAETA